MALVVFGIAWTGLGLLTASGGLRATIRWPIHLPWGWLIFVGIPGGLGFALVGIYGLVPDLLPGWTGIVMIAVSILAIFVTPRPFAEHWANGLRAKNQRGF